METELSLADERPEIGYRRVMSNMASGNTIAEVAALIGDVARANILSALMGGRALTASELAWHAGVSAQTTSGHLAKLTTAHLLAVEKQGRHRYFRLASPEIARTMEALMTLAGGGPARYRPVGPKDEALRTARSCYDHLAGRIGVALAASLCDHGHVVLADGAGSVTEAGRRFLGELGVDVDTSGPSQRPLCRTCLDWSERRPHLAGRLGAALLERLIELRWLARTADSRVIRITAPGHGALAGHFGIHLERQGGPDGPP